MLAPDAATVVPAAAAAAAERFRTERNASFSPGCSDAAGTAASA